LAVGGRPPGGFGGVPIRPPGGVVAVGGGEPMRPPGGVVAVGGGDPMRPPGGVVAVGGGEPMRPPGGVVAVGGGEPMRPPGGVVAVAVGGGVPIRVPVVGGRAPPGVGVFPAVAVWPGGGAACPGSKLTAGSFIGPSRSHVLGPAPSIAAAKITISRLFFRAIRSPPAKPTEHRGENPSSVEIRRGVAGSSLGALPAARTEAAGGLECRMQNAQRKMHIGRLDPFVDACRGPVPSRSPFVRTRPPAARLASSPTPLRLSGYAFCAVHSAFCT
jgi:hypothetical protein